MNKESSSAQFDYENEQQLAAQQIKAIKDTYNIKFENEARFAKIMEKQIHDVKKKHAEDNLSTRTINALRLRCMKEYYAEEVKERQAKRAEEEKNLQFMTAAERKEYAANAAYRLKEDFNAQRAILMETIKCANEGTEARKKAEQELHDLVASHQTDLRNQRLKDIDDEYTKKKKELGEEKKRTEAISGIKAYKNTAKGEDLAKIDGAPSEGANKVAGILKTITNFNPKQLLKNNAEQKRAEADAAAEKVAALQEELKRAQEEGASEDEIAAIIQKGQEAQLEATKLGNEAAAAEMANKVADAIAGEYKNQYEKATSILSDYMGSVNARLQGSGENFYKLSDKISNNLSLSPFVKTTKVLEEMKKAVDEGIAYNIEQRAFLSGISDKIATTFDVFDSNLMRIIRLQQADTTSTRMGMEAYLTKMLNNMFQDTSYLKNMADQVTGALVDATSNLSYQASAEFEFVVQKWLGALSSLGLSDNTVGEIAKGINYLATGDVQNLANSTSLQTMFAMAASEANLEYSELLLNGLDADTTNTLLESVVVYLKKIAEGSENQVVRRAYGDIFNLSNSDMKAISNLTQGEISYLAGNMLSYGGMQSEINSQMMQVLTRINLGTMLDNIYENVLYGVASDMANNPVTFAMQKMLNFMEETKTDIAIPFMNVYGFGLDVNATVKDLMQMGLGIGQAMSLAGNVLAALGSGSMGGLNLDSWGAKETTKRGTGGFSLSPGGTLGGVSSSIGTFEASGNSEDMKKDSISGVKDDAEENNKDMGMDEPKYTMETFFKQLVVDEGSGNKIRAIIEDDPNKIYKVELVSPDTEAFQPNLTDVRNSLTSISSTLTSFNESWAKWMGGEKGNYLEIIASHFTENAPLQVAIASTGSGESFLGSGSVSSTSSVPASSTNDTLKDIRGTDSTPEKSEVKVTIPDNLQVSLKNNDALATAILAALCGANQKDGNLYNLIEMIKGGSIPVKTPYGIPLAVTGDVNTTTISPPPN